MRRKSLGIINANVVATGQLLIIYYAFVKCLRKNKNTSKELINQLLIDFKKACDSVRREVLYNILFEFGIPMKLAMLIQMSLNETLLVSG